MYKHDTIRHDMIKHDTIGTTCLIHIMPKSCRAAPLSILGTTQYKKIKKIKIHDMTRYVTRRALHDTTRNGTNLKHYPHI
jgi:hypothetical protein